MNRPEKIDQSDLFSHHRVSLVSSNLFVKLAKKMKIKISQNMGIDLVQNARKIEADSGGQLSRDHRSCVHQDS